MSRFRLSERCSSRDSPGALDYTGFHTPQLDSLFAATRVARSDAERIATWKRVQGVLRDASPVAWLYHSRGVQGVSARLRNVVMDLRGEMVTLARWQTDAAP